jgi:phosphohistidine phosphatase SixA
MQAGLLVAALLIPGASAFAKDASTEALWSALERPGHVVIMRHADAPGTGDPAGFRIGDCATQRNLGEAGRAQARRWGERFRQKGIAVSLVLTSQWCRARETAELMAVGPIEEAPAALNSFFGRPGEREAATEALKSRLAALPVGAATVVLVTHQVNITALTGVFPQSGEAVVLRRGEGGSFQPLGRLRAE